MEPIKAVKTEWVHSGIYAYMEQFRYAALNLIKNTEEENRDEIIDIILAEIREAIENIEFFLKKPVRGEVMQSLNFSPPVGLELSTEMMQAITNLCDEFRKSILKMVFRMSNRERVSSFPFFGGGIMRSILDMKEKVAEVTEVSEFELHETKLDEELDPKIQEVVDQILSSIEGEKFKGPFILDALLFVMKKEGFNNRKELSVYLGVTDNMMSKFFTYKEYDLTERGKKSVNKIRIWFKNQIFKYASNKDIKSLNEILRLIKNNNKLAEEISVSDEEIEELPNSVQYLVRSIIEFVKLKHLKPTQLKEILRRLRKKLDIPNKEQLAIELGLKKQQIFILDRDGIPSKERNIDAFTIIKNWIINQVIVLAKKEDIETLMSLDRCVQMSY